MVMEAGFNKRIPGTRARLRDRQTKATDLKTLPGSRFSADNVPYILWPDLLEEFGSDYDYYTPEGDRFEGLRGILLEGMIDETTSPGRYARHWVDTRDLGREPRSADWIVVGGVTYDIERVDATLFDLQRLVIKRSGQSREYSQCK